MIQDIIQHITKRNLTGGQTPCEVGLHFLRFAAILLLLMVVRVSGVKAQTDYSGTYYIASGAKSANNGNDYTYNPAAPANNFYLCPTKEWIYYQSTSPYFNDNTPGQPFLTTFKCRSGETDPTTSEPYDEREARWTLVKHSTRNCYYIRRNIDGKYLTLNRQLGSNAGKNRLRLHIEETNSPGEDHLFAVETQSTYLVISPVNAKADNKTWYLNVHQGNFNALEGQEAAQKNEGPDGYKNIGGTIGIYSDKADQNAPWYLEEIVPRPVISYNPSESKIVITHSGENTTFYYTIDGSNPTTNSASTTGEIANVTSSVTIKAIAVISEEGCLLPIISPVAEIRVVPAASITLAATEYTYTGSAIKPAVSSVKDGETTIDASEYTVGYNNNTNAGNAATVTITDNAGGDYIVYGSTTFTINPASVTLTANSGSVAYDGTEKTVSGFTCSVGGNSVDNLTFEGVSASGSGTNIGDYPVTFTGVTINTTKDTSGNYVVSETVNGTLTITPKPLTITAGSDTKVYDGTALTKNTYTSDGLMAGDVIESVTITGSQTNAGSSYNVPSAAVVKKGNEVVTANYNIIYNNGTLTITPKTLTVTADAKTKAYGEDDPALTYTSEGLINEDALTGALTREPGENVGEYAINIGTLTAGDNYTIDYTGASLTITKVSLTITAKNNTITYGDAPANNGVTYEGFVNSETASVLGGELAYEYSYTQYGDIGNTYTITPTGLTSGNYDITFVAGTLTVNAKEVGIDWDNIAFTYNGEEHCPTATATATDLVNDDEIGITVTGAQTNAGEHIATASALTGDKAGNYVLPEANTQTFTISSKSIGDGTNLADGYTLDFGEGNTILLTDNVIGSTLVASTDYTVGEDTSTSDKYSQRTVTGAGNYTGSFDVSNVVISFTTDANEEGWSATFAAEAADEDDLGLALPTGVSAFIITGIRGEWAIPEQLNYIPAGVPVLLVANKKLNGFVTTAAESGKVTLVTNTQKDSNMLEEVTEDTPGYDADTQSAPFTTKQIYLLYNNEFVFNKAGNLKKGKVYLNPNHTVPASPSPAPARLQIAWNQTTGIKEGRWEMEEGRSERWYTLDGRRLNGKPSAKGLYIVNGKKTVVK